MKSITSLSARGSLFTADLMNSAVLNGDDPASARWKFGVDEPLEFLGKYEWSQCTAKLPREIVRERGYSGYEEADDHLESDSKVKYWLATGRKEV